MLAPWLVSPVLVLFFVANLYVSASECNCTITSTREKKAYCHFETRQKLTLEAGFWRDWKNCPPDLSVIELVGGKELRFGLGVLAQLNTLQRLSVRNISQVLVQKNSFANLTSPLTVTFEFAHCENLHLEEGSFKNSRSPISVRIEKIHQVVIARATFSWLSDLFISRIDKLKLYEEAFLLSPDKRINTSSTNTEIVLDRVNVEYLERSAFRSSIREIRIVNSNVTQIRAHAFDATTIKRIIFENSNIDQIAKGAFSDSILVPLLRMTNLVIKEISPGALPFGSSQLIIEKSRIHNIQKGAINITVAEVYMAENIIDRIHSMGVQLHKWNSISLLNNTFKELDSKAFSSPYQAPTDSEQTFIKDPECNFTGNTIKKFGHNAFDFAITDYVSINVEDNYFAFNCHCDMSSSLFNFITGTTVDNIVYETSFCNVTQSIAKCHRLPEGYVQSTNFTEQVCSKESVKCEEVQRDAALPPVVPVITPVDDLTVHDEIERERLILGSILVIFVFGMVIVALVSFVKCIKDHNYCGKTRTILRSTANHVFAASPGHDLTPTASAHSFSQYTVHEYAEVQRKKEALRDDSPLEDKATQTLPEELTQELIESLREKLTDPSNYSEVNEAKDMIEHLYDLIKTEDTNKNETSSLNLDDLGRENTYEAIQRRRSEPGKQMCHMWTRAPSPDKLLPHALYSKVIPPDVTRPQLVCEYLEPRDRSAHLYAEPNFPRVCDYAEPTDTAQHVYTELPNLPRNQKRPLPRPSS